MNQRKKIDGVKLYFEWIPALEFLSDEDKGKLLYYAMCYASSNYKAEFELDQSLRCFWQIIKERIDKDNEKYESKCEENYLISCYREYKKKQKKDGNEILSYNSWKIEKQYIDYNIDIDFESDYLDIQLEDLR